MAPVFTPSPNICMAVSPERFRFSLFFLLILPFVFSLRSAAVRDKPRAPGAGVEKPRLFARREPGRDLIFQEGNTVPAFLGGPAAGLAFGRRI